MDVTQATGGRVYGVQTQLTPAINLNVYLVKDALVERNLARALGDENYSQA